MNSPAFQFYVQDFLTGTMHMTAEEIGAYMLLLCHQWDKGALPDSDAALLKISRTRMKVLDVVRTKFDRGEDGLMRNARLEKERGKQASYKEKMAEAGRRSGESRRAKSEPGSKLVHRMLNSSSSISSSSSTSLSISKADCVNKKIIVGNQEYNTTASALMQEQFAAGIAELMLNQYRTLRVEDVYAQVDLDCPTGTIFTNPQHLLNKFKCVAAHLLTTKQDKPKRDKPHDYSQYKRTA